MSYKLTEIIDYLVEGDSLHEDFESDLYDMFCCDFSKEASITIPEFTFKGKAYPLKKFDFKRKVKEVKDSYCEGKFCHHYEITLKDTKNSDIYQVYTECYNGEWQSINVELLEPKQKEIVKACCNKQKIISVKSGGKDLEVIKNKNMQNVSLEEAGIGKNGSLDFSFCLSCKKIQ